MHIKRWAATLLAALLLAFAAGSASANRFSISNQTFKVIWNSLTMKGDILETLISVECNVTMEGSFHSRTIAKVMNALIGHITRASVGTCSGGEISVLAASLPWHVTYNGYTGTLPRSSGVINRIINLSLLVRDPLGQSCLYRSTTTRPWAAGFFLNEEARVIGYIPEEAFPIPKFAGPMFCSLTMAPAGVGGMTLLTSTQSIFIRLI